jgi:hypothetical protein
MTPKPNATGFTKPEIQGIGQFRPPPSKLLDCTCVPGDIVNWSTIGGENFLGELKEWDSNVAIVDIGGRTKAVEC